MAQFEHGQQGAGQAEGGLGVSGFEARQVEQVGDEVVEHSRVRGQPREQVATGLVVERVPHPFEREPRSLDDRYRGSQLVRDGGHEVVPQPVELFESLHGLVLGLELPGVLQGHAGLCPQELERLHLPIRQVVAIAAATEKHGL